MKKILFAVFALAMVAGCTKKDVKDIGNAVGCAIQETAVTTVSTVIAEPDALDCKNVAAIKSFLDEKAGGLNLCKKDEVPATTSSLVSAKSAIGDVACLSLVASLETQILSEIPASWECSGGKLTEDAKTKLLEKCKKVL